MRVLELENGLFIVFGWTKCETLPFGQKASGNYVKQLLKKIFRPFGPQFRPKLTGVAGSPAGPSPGSTTDTALIWYNIRGSGQSGPVTAAPNHGFSLITLKILFRISRVLLQLWHSRRRFKIVICSVILDELESFRNYKGFSIIFPKILDAT